ncbi:MAG: DUF1844 domain-containing protein [Desulfobacteraceae bacterium]|nr:MAG: DUF1844 domain-containing protein [Desulfobacteraceae bacterium]
MAEEEKGFVIKDRRSFDEGGELKKESQQTEKTAVKEESRKTQARAAEAQRPPLPEVNFSSLIFSLSSSALLHLGEIPDPETNEKLTDLVLAKHSIDIIAMLQEKTKGNLNDDEKHFLESMLADLRIRFVKASK